MKSNRLLCVLLALLMLMLSGCAPALLPVEAASMDGEVPSVRTLSFDVAEDMSRFFFDEDVAFEDGMLADGSSFIT